MLYLYRDPKTFQDTCYKTKTTDDLTVGAIISNVNICLMEWLNVCLFYSHGAQL